MFKVELVLSVQDLQLEDIIPEEINSRIQYKGVRFVLMDHH